MSSSGTRGPSGEALRASLVSIVVIAIVGAIALIQSWNGWLHPIIDAGRDLYIPEQIRGGTKLYRDIEYFYPPLAPYVLALVTSLAGSSLRVYAWLGIVVSGLVATTMFTIARRQSGELAGFSAGFLFVSACMVSAAAYGSTFMFPYSHNAVFGMALFLALEGTVLSMFLVGASKVRVATAIVLACLCSLTKIEFAAFVLATVVVVGAISWFGRQFDRTAVTRLTIATLSGIAGTWAIVWVFFLDAGAMGEQFFSNVFPPALLGGSVAQSFYARVTGTDQLSSHLILALVGFMGVAGYAVLLRMLDASIRIERRSVRIATILVLLVSIAFAAWFLGTDLFFRGWTLLQLALVPFALRDLVRLRDEPASNRLVALPLLLWFALCGTSRIWLNLAPVWYGFVLILPVILLIVDVLFRYFPERGLYSRRAALMWLPLILVIGGRNLVEQRTLYMSKRFAIESPRGTIRDYSAERAMVLNQFLAYADANSIRELVVIPEGLTINYLSSIPNPSRYHTFTPAEMPSVETERPVVREVERVRPRYIAITTQQAAAFGPSQFGRDYGRELWGFVRKHYRLEKEWRTSTFSLFLFRWTEPDLEE